MRRLTGIMLIIVLVFSLFTVSWAQEEGKEVVTLGNDLDSDQRDQMLSFFGVEEKEVEVLTVTNEEEYHYLKEVASKDQIGSRAISSAYVQMLEEGEGLEIRTHNISWVNESMYASALTTAGIQDARVIAAAPFSVSGTASLTGMIKAFEEITGEAISEDKKETAHQELFLIGELSQDTGEEDKVSQLVWKVKEEVIRQQLRDTDKIRDVVESVSNQIDLQLTEEQVEQVVQLMEKISYLDISIQDVREQFQEFIEENPEVKGWLIVIFDWIRRALDTLLEMLRT